MSQEQRKRDKLIQEAREWAEKAKTAATLGDRLGARACQIHSVECLRNAGWNMPIPVHLPVGTTLQ